MKYKVLVRKGEDGWYIASVPSLPGCHTQGKTIEEALDNAEEAVRGYLKVAKKLGDVVVGDDSETIEAMLTIDRNRGEESQYSFGV
jgi:antitoxin HicB